MECVLVKIQAFTKNGSDQSENNFFIGHLLATAFAVCF